MEYTAAHHKLLTFENILKLHEVMLGRVSEKRVSEVQRSLENLLSTPLFANVNLLLEESSKLMYQKTHLQEYLERLNTESKKNLNSIQSALEATFDLAIKICYPNLTNHETQLCVPNKTSFGDYQCNSALRLSKEVDKLSGVNPKKIAECIISSLPLTSLIDKVEVAGPGFINIWLSKQVVVGELKKILTYGVTPPYLADKKFVIIDMSSPNIAKEMHVGHLRSTIIGESIARLLSFLGHRVLKLNHIGDWGTQFGMLIAHLNEKFPDLDKPPPIGDLQAFYRSAKIRFDEEDEFRARAYSAVVKLQQKVPEYIRSWQQICDISRREFVKVYERLEIHDLVERGESYYQSRMVNLVEELKENNLLQIDEGRQILWPPGCDVPLTIVKSDGGFTYDTSDLAALFNRLFEEKADWILYVVDIGQGVHFNNLLAAAELIGFYKPAVHRVQHVAFGVVLGEDKKKFKTRSGDTVRLIDLLDEGMERSKKRLIEKGRDKELTPEEFELAQKAVAYGCIKYADLSHHRTNDYVFSFDKMLDDKGNTAVYLLYAYTRIRSIIRSTGYSADKLKAITETEPFKLEHPAEWNLAKTLCRLSEILLKMQNDLLIHTLCDYLYELCCTFTSFYDACYCIERDRETGTIVRIYNERLLLCEATSRIMKCCFDILGINTVEKM